MKRVWIFAGVGLLAAAILSPPAIAAAEKAITDVFVTNTRANPVPVAGTVDVGNLPETQAVTVEQSGPIAVDIGPRDHVPAEPFEASAFLGAGIGGWPLDSQVLVEVPEGKTLVIEFVSAWFIAEPGLVPRLDISEGIVGVGGSKHYVSMTQESTATAPFRPNFHRSTFTGTEQIRLYARPGSTVRANLFVPLLLQGDPTAQVSGTVNVTGYFVDVSGN